MEALAEVGKGMLHPIVVGNVSRLFATVGESHRDASVAHADAGQRMEADERTAVGLAVVIGTFHQETLRIEVAHLHVGIHRRVAVGEQGFARSAETEI